MLKKVLVLMAVVVGGYFGSWWLWGGTYDGYVPVSVKVQVADAADGRPIAGAIVATLNWAELLDDREFLEKVIEHSLRRESGRLDDIWTDLLWPIHARRTDSDGNAAVVALARMSGARIGEWEISRNYHKSQPALALVRAPGYVEARIELRPFMNGPVSTGGQPEHMVADLGSVRLTRE